MVMNMKKILKQIAKEHNTTPEAVYEEMKQAIRAGCSNPSPIVQTTWSQLALNQNADPAPEDLIEAIANHITK